MIADKSLCLVMLNLVLHVYTYTFFDESDTKVRQLHFLIALEKYLYIDGYCT